MGVSGISLSISCRENSVDKNKSADNLGSKGGAIGVAGGHKIDSAAGRLEVMSLNRLHQAGAGDGAEALHYHVEQSSG